MVLPFRLMLPTSHNQYAISYRNTSINLLIYHILLLVASQIIDLILDIIPDLFLISCFLGQGKMWKYVDISSDRGGSGKLAPPPASLPAQTRGNREGFAPGSARETGKVPHWDRLRFRKPGRLRTGVSSGKPGRLQLVPWQLHSQTQDILSVFCAMAHSVLLEFSNSSICDGGSRVSCCRIM